VFVAQASCLWGNRASRLVQDKNASAGKMPAGPTDKMSVLRFSLSSA